MNRPVSFMKILMRSQGDQVVGRCEEAYDFNDIIASTNCILGLLSAPLKWL